MRFNTVALITIIISVAGCGSTPNKQTNYVAEYMQALNTYEGVSADGKQKLSSFSRLYEDLKQPELKVLLEQVYAESIYFNDTVKTITSRDDLIEYLLETADNLESSEVVIADIVTSGHDYYVRWSMNYSFKVAGKLRESSSIGITHLRLDAEGKVILHQDYWDSAQGLYKHIPFVGYLIRKVQARL